MLVDLMDGRCRTCDGRLVVVDADDATMTVQCEECDDSYLVEPDAFGDGGMHYYVAAMTQRMKGGDA